MTSKQKNTAQEQDMKQLQERFNDLKDERTRTERDLKHAEDGLDALKKQARDQYGTDDLEELQAKLDAMREENERKRTEYQDHLEGITEELANLENSGTDEEAVE